MDEQTPFDPYAKSVPKSEQPADLQPENRMPSAVPDYIFKTKEYIKQHPEVIRQVAGDEIDKLEAYLDTLPLGIGQIGKAKLNEFLGAPGGQSDTQQGVKFEPGNENSSVQVQTDDEHISANTWSEIIEYMIELDQQGFTPGRIRDDILHDYGVELHPLKIKKQIEEYYRKVDLQQSDTEIIDAESTPVESDDKARKAMLNVMKKLQAENNRWRAEKTKNDAIQRDLKFKRDIQDVVEEAIEKSHTVEPISKIGLIRRFLRWAI